MLVFFCDVFERNERRWNKQMQRWIWYCKILNKAILWSFTKIDLLYNFIVLSVSPREFLAMHLYDPKSFGPIDLMRSVMSVL